MASQGNRHCANCIGTLSFSVGRTGEVCRSDEPIETPVQLVANSCDPRRPLLNGGSRSPHGNSSFGRAQRRVQLQRWVCSGDAVFRRVTLTACLIRFRPAINQSKRLRVSLFPCIAAAAASPADAEPRMANRGTRRQQLQPATARLVVMGDAYARVRSASRTLC